MRIALALAVLIAGCTESARVLAPLDGGLVDGGLVDGGLLDGGLLDGGLVDGGLVDAALPDADASIDSGAPIVGALDVAAGGAHACAVFGGLLACWGDGSEGALGIGAGGDRLAPVQVGIDLDWASIEAGESSTCGARRDTGLFCWGANDHGQLGLGDRSPRPTPTPVPLPAMPALFRSSRDHGCAVLRDAAAGRLVCWGVNAEGQLGRDDTYPGADGLSPVEVAGELRWRTVATGQGHTCGIAIDGSLHCWGRNTESQLGLGAGAPIQIRRPQQVGADLDWVEVACGQSHSCAVRDDGSLWCWGDDFAGQLGIARGSRLDVPTQVGSDAGWIAVSTFVFHTCGVRDDGSLWCWGRNVEGQLGTGDTVDRDRPTRVGDRSDWIAVAAGWFHTCAQRRDGSVWCTGENGDGRLGIGEPTRRSVLTQVLGVGVE